MSAAPTFDFSGASVLVTGGTAGIGHGIARAYLDAGATVTITGTRASADEYDTDLDGFRYLQCRLADPDQIASVAASFDGLDVVVNNAGQVYPDGDENQRAGFEAAIMVNLAGAFQLANECRSRLAASDFDGGASVVNLASMASYFSLELAPGYAAAKSGILGVTRTLAVAWAKDGIRVNAVAPGLIETNMTAGMIAYEPLSQPLMDRIALRRWGTPDDVAPVVLFLTSPAARYITGQTLPIDGGLSIHG
jgi:3-oxoacyl-[acyl-carrier protein] reductase